jgi:PqqD family protein of HPr-rel-A system
MSNRFQRNPSIEAAPLQQEVMLFNASTKKFCVLNASAALIWERLATPRTAEELASALCESFETSGRASIEGEVDAVLGQLERLELVSRES